MCSFEQPQRCTILYITSLFSLILYFEMFLLLLLFLLVSFWLLLSSIGGITVKIDLMPVIIYKNDTHLVTIYNVMFSNVTDILARLSYIFY